MIAALATLAGLGFLFGLVNAVSGRLQHTDAGAFEHYPSWLLFASILAVAGVFAWSARAVATSTGATTLLAYAVGQAAGATIGTHVANSFVYRRFHPAAKNGNGNGNGGSA